MALLSLTHITLFLQQGSEYFLRVCLNINKLLTLLCKMVFIY